MACFDWSSENTNFYNLDSEYWPMSLHDKRTVTEPVRLWRISSAEIPGSRQKYLIKAADLVNVWLQASDSAPDLLFRFQSKHWHSSHFVTIFCQKKMFPDVWCPRASGCVRGVDGNCVNMTAENLENNNLHNCCINLTGQDNERRQTSNSE